MIEWFVLQSCMTEVRRRPRDRAVAEATVLGGIKVPHIHTRRSRSVVAGRTRTQDLIVINGYDRRPDIGAVTVFADVGGERMQRPLARCVGTVMAAAAVVDNVCVIEIGR